MASHPHSIPAPAQQPGLRSFIVSNQVSAGHLAFEVVDQRVAPHLARGDFAIVDTEDREPMHGEMFLVEWASSGERQIVEIRKCGRPDCIPGWDGVEAYWDACWQAPVRFLTGENAGTTPWRDGPYKHQKICDRIIGRVVGIYEPDFRQLIAA